MLQAPFETVLCNGFPVGLVLLGVGNNFLNALRGIWLLNLSGDYAIL